MRRAHAFGFGVVLATAALSLTGCEKPAPSVTVFSGAGSVHTEALCWAFDADRLEAGQCAEDLVNGRDTSRVPTLDVDDGNTVGISVDEIVAETGWTIGAVGGQPVTPQPLTSSYYRFTFGTGATEPILLQIVAGQNTGDMRGVWIVQLQPQQG